MIKTMSSHPKKTLRTKVNFHCRRICISRDSRFFLVHGSLDKTQALCMYFVIDDIFGASQWLCLMRLTQITPNQAQNQWETITVTRKGPLWEQFSTKWHEIHSSASNWRQRKNRSDDRIIFSIVAVVVVVDVIVLFCHVFAFCVFLYWFNSFSSAI